MNSCIYLVLILSVFVFLVLALSSGVYFDIPQRLASLNVYVVNFDGQVDPYLGGDSFVGTTIVGMAENMARSGRPSLGFTTVDPNIFGNDTMKVRQAVYDFKAYAAM